MTTTEQKDQELQEIGQNAYDAIAEMVAALNCDYDRLEELRNDRETYTLEEYKGLDWSADCPDDAEELAELESAAGDCESTDDARERFRADPLSLRIFGEKRDGEWEADNYELLLTTGGPAVRIIGDLNQYNEPETAILQAQDWGTPWTEFGGGDDDVLMAYVQCFYFGE